MAGVVSQYVIPSIGLVTANMLFLAPLPLVLGIARTRRLGAANPLPFPMICGNCLSWMLYSTVLKDFFVFWSNFPGWVLGLYYTCTVFTASDLTERQLRTMKVVFGACLAADHLAMMLAYLCFPSSSASSTREVILGANCIMQLVVFYVSPLATLVEVLKQKDSSSLDLRLAIVMLANGSVWTAYGSYLHDYFILGPNALGAVNGLVQVVCCFLYPRLTDKLGSTEGTDLGLRKGLGLDQRLEEAVSAATTPTSPVDSHSPRPFGGSAGSEPAKQALLRQRPSAAERDLSSAASGGSMI